MPTNKISTLAAFFMLLAGQSVITLAEELPAIVYAMRSNDTLLSCSVIEAKLVVDNRHKQRPEILQEFVPQIADGVDPKNVPSFIEFIAISQEFGTKSGVAIEDVPIELRGKVAAIREGLISFKAGPREEKPRHYDPPDTYKYDFLLCWYGRDVAMHKYGGRRRSGALDSKVASVNYTTTDLAYLEGEWALTENTSQYTVNLVHEGALWNTFALGIGFGSRIVSAKVQSVENGLTSLEAKISIWPGQHHDAQLTVNEFGIVTKARIDTGTRVIHSRANGWREVEADIGVAQHGAVEVYNSGGSIRSHHSLTVSDVRYPIVRDEFDRYADMSAPDGVPVYVRRGNEIRRIRLDPNDNE